MAQMIPQAVLDQLKAQIDQDSKTKEALGDITEKLEREVAYSQGVISRVHATRVADYAAALLPQLEAAIKDMIATTKALEEEASKHPYYKYNFKWTRHVRGAIFTIVLCAFLGGLGNETKPGELGRLLSLEEVGAVLQADLNPLRFTVPVNIQDRDVFHITIEEYLLSLTDLTNELSRLTTNTVTLGDFEMAVRISSFVRDLHAGFQLLNLKNDILRKRVDSVKYDVKKVEDVVYDLSLRNLIPARQSAGAAQ
ncbi:Translin-1 [Pyricularia oryzae]